MGGFPKSQNSYNLPITTMMIMFLLSVDKSSQTASGVGRGINFMTS